LPAIWTTVQAVSGEVSLDLLQDVQSINPYLFIGGGMTRNEFHFPEGFQIGAYFRNPVGLQECWEQELTKPSAS